MSGRFWLQALLVVSLAFNIAFVGMHCLVKPPRPMHGPEAFEERITHDMSSSDANIVHAAFAAHKDEFDKQRKTMDGAIINVRKALKASPINQDELETAMDEARQARAASENIMEHVMLDASKNLSPAGRLQLVPPPPGDRGPGSPPMDDRGPPHGDHGGPGGPMPPPPPSDR